MKLQLGGLLAAAALAFAPAAHAATIVFNFGNSGGSNSGGSNDGNVRSYTVSGLGLQASGWTNDTDASPDKIRAEYLGYYSGYGLGVTNDGDSGYGSGPEQHTVDNYGGQTDFIFLKFSQAVELTSAYFDVFDVYPYGGADGDATVFYKNGLAKPTDGMTTGNYLSSLNSINVPGGSSDGSRTISNTGKFSDTWIISAKTGDSNDGWKLKSLSVNTAGAVPEPATWAMMIGGFFGAGAMVRRRREGLAAA